MKSGIKNLLVSVYYVFIVIYLEIMVKLAIGMEFKEDLLLIILFSASLGLVLYLIHSVFNGKTRYAIMLTIVLVLCFFYASQLIYYKFFRTFYIANSAKNGTQVAEMWKDIANKLKDNWNYILYLFIPFITYIFAGFRIKRTMRPGKGLLISAILLAVLLHATGVYVVMGDTVGVNSTYDLYYKTSIPTLAAKRLGIFTFMRVDIKKNMLGLNTREDEIILDMTIEDDFEGYVGEPETEPEEPKEYNVIDIDLEALIEAENDEEIANIHRYVAMQQPTEKNDKTGIYEGYNLILITAEGFSSLAVDKEVTPTLYKLVSEGYNFTNYYNPIWNVSTLDGEYVECTGLIPKDGVWSFVESSDNYLPFTMGMQFSKMGYTTLAYHNHTYNYYKRDLSHPNMGYIYKGLGNGLKVKKQWPESDIEMMQVTIPEFIDEENFHVYYLTVSGHLEYNFFGNRMAMKNKSLVDELDLPTGSKAYLATQIEFDRAMKILLDSLEEKGILDKTLIVIGGDHYPYGLDDESINALAGHEVEKNFELYKSSLIIYTGGMEPETVDKYSSSIDIIPTISNMLGLEYDSRMLSGRDIFSEAEPLVVFNNRSFITDKGMYNAETEEFTSFVDTDDTDEYVKEVSDIVARRFYFAAKMLDNDYYRKVFGE